jgi:hypothetical protein
MGLRFAETRNRDACAGFGLLVTLVLVLASPALAQNTRATPPAAAPAKRAAPAPVRDLNGVWATALPDARLNPTAPLTAFGKAQFATHKNSQAYSVAASNDPLKMCDPQGFPRNILNELRGIEFEQVPNKMLELLQYQRTWREIWTDGRKLPTNVGEAGGPDPRWYGFSSGKWDGDYTFVVDTSGTDETPWLDRVGDPRSSDLKVEERYVRSDHDTLEMTVTINDPKTYTMPYEAAKVVYKWNPEQQLEEQLCVPSVMSKYLSIIGNPADTTASSGGK